MDEKTTRLIRALIREVEFNSWPHQLRCTKRVLKEAKEYLDSLKV